MIRPWLLSLLVVICLTATSAHRSTLAQDTFLGKSADDWARQLKSSVNARERRDAAFALGKMGDKALTVLEDLKLAYIAEKDAKVRETILFALGDIALKAPALKDQGDMEPLLLDALKDKDALVRRSAAYAVGCLGSKSPTIHAALETALDDPNSLVRQNAAWAFGKIATALGVKDSERVLPCLSKALNDSDPFVKRDAANSLLAVGNLKKLHDLVPALLPLCGEGNNSEVRRAALNVLVRVVNATDTAAIGPLQAAMKDRDLENKRNAALALTNIGGKEAASALPILLEAIQNGDLEVRRQSVLALRNLGSAAAGAVEDLIRLLRTDKDQTVRYHAALALGGIGKASEPAIAALVERLQDTKESINTRYECVMTLRAIGPVPASKQYLPALLEVLGDADQDPRARLRIPILLNMYGNYLKTVDGALDTFVKVCKEPLNKKPSHHLLRYETASAAAWQWRQDAPEAALDVLAAALHDKSIKILGKTESGVGGAASETKAGKTTVITTSQGDGRILWVNAIAVVGVKRYAKRDDIMQQLKNFAADKTIYEPLQKRAAQLVQDAEKLTEKSK